MILTSFQQIHAYNLETNCWEEITTKPHDKIGLFYSFNHLQLPLTCHLNCSETCLCLLQVILLPGGAIAVSK